MKTPPAGAICAGSFIREPLFDRGAENLSRHIAGGVFLAPSTEHILKRKLANLVEGQNDHSLNILIPDMLLCAMMGVEPRNIRTGDRAMYCWYKDPEGLWENRSADYTPSEPTEELGPNKKPNDLKKRQRVYYHGIPAVVILVNIGSSMVTFLKIDHPIIRELEVHQGLINSGVITVPCAPVQPLAAAMQTFAMFKRTIGCSLEGKNGWSGSGPVVAVAITKRHQVAVFHENCATPTLHETRTTYPVHIRLALRINHKEHGWAVCKKTSVDIKVPLIQQTTKQIRGKRVSIWHRGLIRSMKISGLRPWCRPILTDAHHVELKKIALSPELTAVID